MIIVDRILNGLAVCENDGIMLDIPLTQIDGSIQEGDVLCLGTNSTQYGVDKEKTEERRNRISRRFEKLTKQSK